MTVILVGLGMNPVVQNFASFILTNLNSIDMIYQLLQFFLDQAHLLVLRYFGLQGRLRKRRLHEN